MINRFKALFATADTGASGELGRDEELHLAAAALLVESACLDGHFDGDERSSIERLLKERFELEEDEVSLLVADAEEAVAESGELYGFTKVIKDRYSSEERVEMIEMLWEVAFADGRLDHFEDNLIRRVGGLIFVSDRDRGDARKRVMARLGITRDAV